MTCLGGDGGGVAGRGKVEGCGRTCTDMTRFRGFCRGIVGVGAGVGEGGGSGGGTGGVGASGVGAGVGTGAAAVGAGIAGAGVGVESGMVTAAGADRLTARCG